MRSSVLASDDTLTSKEASVEISVRGEWVKVPALRIGGAAVIVQGKWLKIATVSNEEWTETELENPDLYVEKLKQKLSPVLRADLFTFSQKLPNTTPKHAYPMELESIA